MSATAFLRQVPVLADLSDELLDRLAADAGSVVLRAGEWLFREGEEAASLFVIRAGRLDVVAEGPPEVPIRVMRRGEVLGELALPQEGVRTASVRARSDVELVEVGRSQFEILIREAPSFALGLTRARAHGTVAELREERRRSPAEMLATLDRAERSEDRVALAGGATSPGGAWTDFCLREAELVIARGPRGGGP